MHSKMANLLSKGYAEKVPEAELNNPGKWYLPLHPAFHKRKPGKVRLTHDAAAQTKGMSLNDFLLKSPDMVCGLVQTLLAGRIHPIMFKADIAEFFLRVRMAV